MTNNEGNTLGLELSDLHYFPLIMLHKRQCESVWSLPHQSIVFPSLLGLLLFWNGMYLHWFRQCDQLSQRGVVCCHCIGSYFSQLQQQGEAGQQETSFCLSSQHLVPGSAFIPTTCFLLLPSFLLRLANLAKEGGRVRNQHRTKKKF